MLRDLRTRESYCEFDEMWLYEEASVSSPSEIDKLDVQNYKII